MKLRKILALVMVLAMMMSVNVLAASGEASGGAS